MSTSKSLDFAAIDARSFDTKSESLTVEQKFPLGLAPFELALRQNCLQSWRNFQAFFGQIESSLSQLSEMANINRVLISNHVNILKINRQVFVRFNYVEPKFSLNFALIMKWSDKHVDNDDLRSMAPIA